MLDRPDTDRKYEKLFVRLTNGIAKLFKNYQATHVADLAHAMIVCVMTRKDKMKRILTPEIHELARQKYKIELNIFRLNCELYMNLFAKQPKTAKMCRKALCKRK
jgi:hypothetical protein